MESKSISLPVPNAVFFITGSDTRDMPKIERGSNIWSTPTCIAVGCTPDVDGETRIAIGLSPQVSLSSKPAFDGLLETPSRVVSVDFVPGKKVLEQNVLSSNTRIRIWANHPIAPNDVTIGLG
jgi:hypothetical protein